MLSDLLELSRSYHTTASFLKISAPFDLFLAPFLLSTNGSGAIHLSYGSLGTSTVDQFALNNASLFIICLSGEVQGY